MVGVRVAGLQAGQAVVADFELSEHEISLRRACRIVDALDSPQARLDADGRLIDSSQGRMNHHLPSGMALDGLEH